MGCRRTTEVYQMKTASVLGEILTVEDLGLILGEYRLMVLFHFLKTRKL